MVLFSLEPLKIHTNIWVFNFKERSFFDIWTKIINANYLSNCKLSSWYSRWDPCLPSAHSWVKPARRWRFWWPPAIRWAWESCSWEQSRDDCCSTWRSETNSCEFGSCSTCSICSTWCPCWWSPFWRARSRTRTTSSARPPWTRATDSRSRWDVLWTHPDAKLCSLLAFGNYSARRIRFLLKNKQFLFSYNKKLMISD